MDIVFNALRNNNIELVMLDVGSSGELFAPFEYFRKDSKIICFDPCKQDLSILDELNSDQLIYINKAISCDKEIEKIKFYLTTNSECSSTLKPKGELLERWPYASLFKVSKEVYIDSITIEDAINQIGVDHIDWIKLDTQGTDLRIIESLPESLKNSLIVCDVEPGYYEHYNEADLFPKLHTKMIEHGFWLANLEHQTQPRISEKHWLKLLEKLKADGLKHNFLELTRSPTAAEACYMRTIESALILEYGFEKFLVLWAISMSKSLFAFAYDVACTIEREFSVLSRELDLVFNTYNVLSQIRK